MFEDGPFAAPKPRVAPLEELSIHELEERIEALEAEIQRCRDLIASKRASASAADSFFRKSD